MKTKSSITFVLVGFFLWLLSCSNAVANTSMCRTAPGMEGANIVKMLSTKLKPFNSIPLGEVLGTASLSVDFTCIATYQPGTFALHIKPNTGEPGSICNTGVEGVGIRYKDANNQYIPCTSSGMIFTIGGRQGVPVNRKISVRLDFAAEFVKTKETAEMSPGAHELLVSPKNKVMASWLESSTSLENWGNILLASGEEFVVSTCTAISSHEVDFGGAVNLQGNEEVSVPFELTISGCGNEADTWSVNNTASLSFASTKLRSDGTLDIGGPCQPAGSPCATGALIQLKTGQGNSIDLKSKYKLSTGDFSVSTGSVKHRFIATIRRAPEVTQVKQGLISSSVTVIFSPL